MAEIHVKYLGGNCPVQSEGTIDGKEFYFRARHNHWSMSIGGDDLIGKPDWYYEEDYGEEPFSAGWMSQAQAADFMDKAFQLYAERGKTFS